MRILVACEFSGIVRTAFERLGHDAWSCDLLPSELLGNHLQCDVRTVLERQWDLMIAHPPCTYLAVSAAWKNQHRRAEQLDALEFVRTLLDAPIPRIALENPVSVISTAIRKPDQIIQPWQYGHPEMKRTCIWLKRLPCLIPTDIVIDDVAKGGSENRVLNEAPGPERWKRRSRTFQGIADAMALQWGRLNRLRPR